MSRSSSHGNISLTTGGGTGPLSLLHRGMSKQVSRVSRQAINTFLMYVLLMGQD